MMLMNMVEDEANGNILPTQNLLNMPSSSQTVANSVTSSPQRISGSSTESFPSPGVKKKHTDFESKYISLMCFMSITVYSTFNNCSWKTF